MFEAIIEVVETGHSLVLRPPELLAEMDISPWCEDLDFKNLPREPGMYRCSVDSDFNVTKSERFRG